jgi:hypothetical protein
MGYVICLFVAVLSMHVFWCLDWRDGLEWDGTIVKVRVANNFKVGKVDLSFGVMVMAIEGTVFLWIASMFKEQIWVCGAIGALGILCWSMGLTLVKLLRR